MTSRIGIFGGSFDPVHIGHLIVASDICDRLALDVVHFVLAPRPPHKSRLSAPDDARIEMLRLAITGDERFSLDLREFDRRGPSFSVDTIESFAAELPGAELFFLMGEDSLADLHTWKRPDRILELAHLAVAARPGALVDPARLTEPGSLATARIAMVETPEIGISSTLIRDRRSRGESIRYLVPAPVERFIVDQALYMADDREASFD